MKKLFTNILVPVDLAKDADTSIREAIGIADQLKCHIHFLHLVQENGEMDDSVFNYLKTDILERYKERLHPSLSITITRQQGAPEKNIIEYYNRNMIDLILLCQARKTFPFFFNKSVPVDLNRLIKKVSCPVLTIYGHPVIPFMKNIVLPVGDLLPRQKLLFATYLAKLSHSTIHLISTRSTGEKSQGSHAEVRESLYKSYRLLRDNTDLPVECLAVPGNNLAEVTWDYAKKINADLILVYPGKESLLSGFLNGLRSRYLNGTWSRSLFNLSSIPVMTVS
ncbi:universal stress protein [Flavitalea flava]